MKKLLAASICLSAMFLTTALADNVGQTAVVRIPGSLKRSPIDFYKFKSLNTVPSAILEARPLQDSDEASRKIFYGVLMPSPSSRDDSKSLGKWYVLINPEIITTVGTPVPLEAEVVVVQDSKNQQAKVVQMIPDCVAAWRRVRIWIAAEKRVQAKTVEEIDAIIESLKETILITLQAGTNAKSFESALIRGYEELNGKLRSVYSSTKDFDLQRVLAALIDGNRLEKLAWAQCFSKPEIIINAGYTIHFDSARFRDALKDANLPNAAPGPKVVDDVESESGIEGSSVDKGIDGETINRSPGNTYAGYEKLQRPQSIAQYKSLYQQARACVAICTGDKAFASGTIIGKNLVLTCAHAVARPGHGGMPAQHDVLRLKIKLGDFDPSDDNTPHSNLIPAKIVFTGMSQDGQGDELDFALLEADIESYLSSHIQMAEWSYRGLRDQRNNNQINEDKMRSQILATSFLPIQPLALADYVATDGMIFNLVGYPEGDTQRICENGEILFPSKLRADDCEDKRVGITKGVTDPQKVNDLQVCFDLMYPKAVKEGNEWFYYHTYNHKSPGIGVVCPAVPGNSGGPAIAEVPGEIDYSCVVGIVSEGLPNNAYSRTPSVQYHEKLVPMTAIIRQLDLEFKGEGYGLGESETWYKHYQVSIIRKKPNGSFAFRP